MSKEELEREVAAPVEKVSAKENTIQTKEEAPEPIQNFIDRLTSYQQGGISDADNYGKVLEQISNRSEEVTSAEALKIMNLNSEAMPFYVKNFSKEDMKGLIDKGFGERVANANKILIPLADVERKRIAALEAEKAVSAENLKRAYQNSQPAGPVSPRNSQKVRIQPQKAKGIFQKIKSIFS